MLSSTSRAEQLYRQAHFDPLTQLPNRLLFRDRLAQELTAAVNAPSRGALIYIDLDHFKKVNDSLGHKAGDQLLAIIAQRLRACVKEGDTVARLGGDEFTVIVRNVHGSGRCFRGCRAHHPFAGAAGEHRRQGPPGSRQHRHRAVPG